MSHFLDEEFQPEYLEWVADISRKDTLAKATSPQGENIPQENLPYSHYYVRMMIAWYFATALAKQPEATLPYIEQKKLTPLDAQQGNPEGHRKLQNQR